MLILFELDKKMYESFIQEKSIPDSLVFTDAIQAELQNLQEVSFNNPALKKCKQYFNRNWLAVNKDTNNVPMPEKIVVWVQTQRYHYTLFSDRKKSYMTLEQIKLLKAIGFKWCGG